MNTMNTREKVLQVASDIHSMAQEWREDGYFQLADTLDRKAHQLRAAVAVEPIEGEREAVAWMGSRSDEIAKNDELRAKVEELEKALRLARPYVVGAYECAFPDAEENQAVLAAIDAEMAKAGGV